MKLNYIIVFSFLIISCVKHTHVSNIDYHTYKLNVLDSIKVELVYEKGMLTGLFHTNKNTGNYSMNSYAFYEDGSILCVDNVIEDTILKSIYFWRNGNISRISHTKNHKPSDINYKLNGIQKSFYENGTLKSRTKWLDGVIIDTLEEFDEQGNRDRFQIFNKNH